MMASTMDCNVHSAQGSSFIMKISFALALLIDEAVIIMTPDLVEWAEIKLVAKDQKEGMPYVIECFGLL